MRYDRSWMAYGWLGGVEAGLITMIVAAVCYLPLRRALRHRPWQGAAIGWAYLLALGLTGGSDLWDMFYFNYAPLQSLQLLRAKLAEVHDPDGIAARVLCELLGAALGLFAAWLVDVRRLREE